ncbi:MAG: hypothetical protein VW338_06750 [Rhodospirillaceae bacterium]
MRLVRVYIATTAGPVVIQRITEEDADLNSVICLAGKAVALPISAAYDAFVRNPTGVVQRHFGHSAYRIDVSEKIDEGYSWQFGVFVAHALKRAARLAETKTMAETIVVATGELDRDLALHPVNGVEEKIQRLQAALTALAGDAKRLVIAVPQGTDQPWRDAFADARLAAGTAIEIIAAVEANDLLSSLGVGLGQRDRPAAKVVPADVTTSGGRRGRVLVLAATLALLAMAVAAGGAVYAPEIKSWMASLKAPAKEAAEARKETSKSAATAEQAPAPPAQPVAAVEVQPLTPAAPPQKAETVVADANITPAPVSAKLAPDPAEPKPTHEPPAAKPTPESLAQSEVDQIPSKLAPPRTPAQSEVDQIPSKLAPPRRPARAEAPDSESDRIEDARLPNHTASDVRISIEELRAPPGRSCADVRSGAARAIRVSAERRGTDHFQPSSQKNLCTVEISAAGTNAQTWMFGRYQRWTRTRPNEGAPDKVIDLGPRREGLRWTVDIPDRLQRSAVFRVVIFSTPKEFTPSQSVLERLDRMDPRSERMQSLLNRLKRRSGVQVTLTQFRVAPEYLDRDRRSTPGRLPPR